MFFFALKPFDINSLDNDWILSKKGTLKFPIKENFEYYLLYGTCRCKVIKGTFYVHGSKPLNIAAKIQSNSKSKYFENEVVCYLRINHKNIVRFIGYDIFLKNNVIVTELCALTLWDYCCYSEKTDYYNYEMSELIRYAVQICDGMEYLHRNQIAHRDVKGNNILLMKIRGLTNYSYFIKIAVN